VRLRIFVEPQQGSTYEQLIAVARTAEEGGFDGFFRSDHFLAIGAADGLPGPTDAWITLAGLARDTTTIRLGTLMSSATFRFPGPLALMAAQVDAMSHGRLELGLGAGWFETEHAAYGLPFPGVRERFERLEEQLAIVTGYWATPPGETYSFEGRHYRIVECPALPKPVQQPRPPVIVGGTGRRLTPRLAAVFADEFNVPFCKLDDAVRQFSRVKRECEALRRDRGTIHFSAAIRVCCGTDKHQIAARTSAILAREPAGGDGDLASRAAVGTPAQIVESLLEWQNAGADTIYLQILDLDDLDHIRLLADEVLKNIV
jgi:F420-dependent oxidoreductase-like protein